MKSKKAKKLIEENEIKEYRNVFINGYDEHLPFQTGKIKLNDCINAVELAEKEMIEKAESAFIEQCPCRTDNLCYLDELCIEKKCGFVKEFIELLDKQSINE
jgi:hypothetical protein